MAGLAVGSGINIKFLNSFSFRIKGIILILFYIAIGLIYNYILGLKSGLPAITLIILSAFLPAFLQDIFFVNLPLRADETYGIFSNLQC